jgi:hypothetical protein
MHVAFATPQPISAATEERQDNFSRVSFVTKAKKEENELLGWWGRNGGRDGGGLTPQVGTAIRAEVQFFAPVGSGGGAVVVCDATSAALRRTNSGEENCMMK